MLRPKKTGPRRVLQQRAPAPIRYCQNPACGAKITNPDNEKYCDRVCTNEHQAILKVERRPKAIACTFCTRPLDPLSRGPYQWKGDTHFCDEICASAWLAARGHYQEISQRGGEVAKAYKAKHGHNQAHEKRSQAVSRNNQTRPPRAKMKRVGNVWGYEAHILPNAARDGYIGHIPELTELVGMVEAKTAKEALKLLRARFVELRLQEAQAESGNEND
jgi:hypothetical protein